MNAPGGTRAVIQYEAQTSVPQPSNIHKPSSTGLELLRGHMKDCTGSFCSTTLGRLMSLLVFYKLNTLFDLGVMFNPDAFHFESFCFTPSDELMQLLWQVSSYMS
jgi:hypothetical protein